MNTNVRTFLRDFASFKAMARKGEVIRVQDKEAEFLFTCAEPRKSLLGCLSGRLAVHADLTQPTGNEADWKPSL